MTDLPGVPFIRWSPDHKYLIVGPGVESDDFKLDNPVEDLGAATLLALQGGTNRVVTRPIPPGIGDVVGPAGATDNALARYDGPSGHLIQDSAVTLSDAGGLAGVTTINGQPVAVLANEGGGAQVFHVGTAGTLRTLVAGPGLSVGQDLPTPGVVSTSADEVTPAGAAAVPAALDLFVSQAGNDTTGTGTAGSPYLTLPRAFRDIRVIGYDVSATVTVLASGGPLALAPGVLALGQGTRGRRALPVEIRGSGRTAVNTGLVVSAATQDPVSGLLDVSVAAPPAGPFALGQIVRFTSGALAAFVIPGTPFPPTAVECFVAEVVGPTTVRLPFALGAPAPGDTFNVLTLDSLVTMTGAVVVRSARLPLIWRDLRVDLLSSGGQGTFILQGMVAGLTGVWLRNTAPFGQFINISSQAGTGRAATVLTSLTYTALGVYFDNTAPGNGFARNSIDPTATIGFANSVFRGNGSPGNMTLLGPIPTLTECYFAGFGSVRIPTSLTQASNLWFAGCSPEPGSGVLEAQAAGAVAANMLRVAGSTSHGVRCVSGGLLSVNGAAIAGCSGDAVQCDLGGVAMTNSLTLAGNVGHGVALYGGSSLTDTSNLDASASSSATDGVIVDNGSSLRANDFTSSGNGGAGLQVLRGSTAAVGNLTCSANTGTGLHVDRSSLSAAGVTASGNGGFGVVAEGAADLSCDGGLTAGTNAAGGVALQEESRLHVNGGGTCTANGGQGVLAVGASVAAFSALVADGNAQNGVFLRGGSQASVSGDVSLGTNLACGLDAAENSVATFSGFFLATGNTLHGAALSSHATVSAGAAALSANGGDGLTASGSASVAAGDLTASNNAQRGAALMDSDLSAGTGLFQGNGDTGAAFGRSSGRFSGGVTSSGNGGGGSFQLAADNGSWVNVAGGFADPGPSAGVSVSLSGNSELSTGGDAAIAGAGDLAVSVRGASRLVIGGVLALTGSLSGVAAAFVAENSEAQAGVLTTTGNAGAGFLLLSGSRFESPNAVTCSGNGGNGFVANEGSWAGFAGATCDSNGGAGIRLENGSNLRALGPVDCGLNAGDGVFALGGSVAVFQALSSGAGPNGGVGLDARTGTKVQTVTGNTMTGAGGDVVVGVNAAVTWATIDTKAPAVVTDYLAAQPTTELCSVST